jgi:hypothetical protein
MAHPMITSQLTLIMWNVSDCWVSSAPTCSHLQLADATVLGTNIVQVVLDVRSFLDDTGLSQSPRQYTLYSLAQLAAYYLQRRHHADQQLQDIVDDFASRFEAEMPDNRLRVAPFDVAAAAATTAPAKRRLVLLAARTAIDAAVAHAAEEAKPVDAALAVEVMNLLTSRDRVRDLFSLRLTCKLTFRRSFPVPCYPLLEMATGVVEDFVGGSGSRHVSFQSVLGVIGLHREDAEAYAVAKAAEAAVVAAEATAAAAVASSLQC